MRTLVGVLVVVLDPRAARCGAVRGLRRLGLDGAGRGDRPGAVQTVVEGLIVLAIIFIGVVILVALLD